MDWDFEIGDVVKASEEIDQEKPGYNKLTIEKRIYRTAGESHPTREETLKKPGKFYMCVWFSESGPHRMILSEDEIDYFSKE